MPKGMGVQVPPRALCSSAFAIRWAESATKTSTMIFYIYHDAAGEWRWRLRANNKKTIAVSGEGYSSQKDCEEAIDLVREAVDAPVLQVEK